MRTPRRRSHAGIYVRDLLDAVPVDKYFELYTTAGEEGGFVRIDVNYLLSEQKPSAKPALENGATYGACFSTGVWLAGEPCLECPVVLGLVPAPAALAPAKHHLGDSLHPHARTLHARARTAHARLARSPCRAGREESKGKKQQKKKGPPLPLLVVAAGLALAASQLLLRRH